jgi:hypothetical protein
MPSGEQLALGIQWFFRARTNHRELLLTTNPKPTTDDQEPTTVL